MRVCVLDKCVPSVCPGKLPKGTTDRDHDNSNFSALQEGFTLVVTQEVCINQVSTCPDERLQVDNINEVVI